MWELLLPLVPFTQRRRRLRGWQEAVAACGLQDVKTSRWTSEITARAGPMALRIKPGGDKGRSTRIVVSIPGPSDFDSVGIHRESRLRLGQEIEIGDFSFDNTFFLEGPLRMVLALLDAETRQLLIRMNTESRLEISFGTLRAEHLSDEQVPNVLPLLLDLARRLSSSTDVPRRLAENAHRDPKPRVRLRNLLVLIHELPEAPETIEALRTACSDPSPEIRLRAAKALGAEGRDVLLDLAEGLVDDTMSAWAVWTLARELPFDRLRAILEHASSRRRFQTARVCMEALGHRGDAAAEPSLILALQHEQADLRVVAANALARVGSVAAVLPLQEATERFGNDPELRRAARQAIAGIQSRLQGASPGQLSLAGIEGGQLSLAQPDAGQLSLATDSGGQLSLTTAEIPPKQSSTSG